MKTPFAYKDRSGQANWPKGVDEIALDDFVRMGVDKTGRLHWDGKPVSVISEQKLTLSRAQKFGAFLVATAALFGGVGGCTQGVNSAHDLYCKLSPGTAVCPPLSR